jgi:hypothetical protein
LLSEKSPNESPADFKAQLPLCLSTGAQFVEAESLPEALQQLLCFVESRLTDADSQRTLKQLKSQIQKFVGEGKRSVGVQCGDEVRRIKFQDKVVSDSDESDAESDEEMEHRLTKSNRF